MVGCVTDDEGPAISCKRDGNVHVNDKEQVKANVGVNGDVHANANNDASDAVHVTRNVNVNASVNNRCHC